MEKSFETLCQEALTALDQGDAREAFSRFRWALEYPGMPELERPEGWREALDVLAALCAAISGEELAQHVREARKDDSPQALYDLGYALMDHRLDGIAATVLRRAYRLAPHSGHILTELCVALMNRGSHQEAVRILRDVPGATEQNSLCRYLLAFNTLMTGDLEAARALLPGLTALREQQEDEEQASSDLGLERALYQMVARADAVRDVTPLDTKDLRGWHFATTGGVLLHLSPFGFDEGMTGRYAYVSDSESRCQEGIQRVAEVLRAADLTPPRVFVLPERSSAILAHATAQVLGLPAVPWPAEGSPEPGLIVLYALDALAQPLLETLAVHHPGQVLWCHALCWTQSAPVSPDLVTYLSQTNISPWGERLRLHPETRQAERVPPRTESVEELARAVASAPVTDEPGAEPLADLPTLRALVTAAKRLTGDAAGGLFRQRGERRWLQDASPVRSSRFA